MVKNRKHTLIFLKEFSKVPVVHIDVEIDATPLQKIHEKYQYTYMSIMSYCFYNVLKKYTEETGKFCKESFINFRFVNCKDITLKGNIDVQDKSERFVGNFLLTSQELLSIERINDKINTSSKIPNRNIELLNRLPYKIGRFLFHHFVNHEYFRSKLVGTYSINSIGKFNVDAIYPIIGASINLSYGRINKQNRMRLVLSFDHRIIDGGIASQILEEIQSIIKEININECY
ncbi:acyltransferase [Streptococcus mutans]|uniref:2-oxo acid dehydrogenase subunit E2 n=1 Tax=Streptococcus mutans TaxID=1309 RepID=UPI0002B58A67|nr:2-oxo acid dehydrogenase subunit E2 [Streptococcus mutans]EMB77236.1 putative acyltransferase [Streptococcus mutans 5SM3]EMB84802.1 putative acyltransferase [Streptococcus mutans N29]EMB88349.1 putative acyltransferase [Streptococcus mutans NMT4863]MCB4979137.1 2-oxo acid dehydrogenase subunit E2 [Streptococcus mutans]MCB5052365.1 2-oxo acid dehydrogenase subunit E2 [Streptococcus mutans]